MVLDIEQAVGRVQLTLCWAFGGARTLVPHPEQANVLAVPRSLSALSLPSHLDT